MQYIVVFEQAPHNWSAYVPDLPGCVAAADTRDETEELIREAIAGHLAALRAYDEPVPSPGTWTAAVDIDEEKVAEITEEFLADRSLPSGDAIRGGAKSRVRPL